MQCVKLAPTRPETLDVFVIELVGEFDFSECDRLTDAFTIARHAPVVMLNLAKTSYLDSTALECLVNLHTTTRKRGASLILLGVQGAVARLFEICEMEKVFDVRSTLLDIGMASVAARRVTLESRMLPTLDLQ